MLRKAIPILAAIIVIAFLGYFHYESCVSPQSAKQVFFLSQSKTCQLPGLVY